MSKSGEINNLSKLVKPNIGIITNIGEAHIENFKKYKRYSRCKRRNNKQYPKKMVL